MCECAVGHPAEVRGGDIFFFEKNAEKIWKRVNV
jgi:hypothetical protein